MPLLDADFNGFEGSSRSTPATSTRVDCSRTLGRDERTGRQAKTLALGWWRWQRWLSTGNTLTLAGEALSPMTAIYSEDKAGALASRSTAGNLGTEVLANSVVDSITPEARFGSSGTGLIARLHPAVLAWRFP